MTRITNLVKCQTTTDENCGDDVRRVGADGSSCGRVLVRYV